MPCDFIHLPAVAYSTLEDEMTSKALEAAMYVALDSERFIKREDVVEIIRAYAENITDEMQHELLTQLSQGDLAILARTDDFVLPSKEKLKAAIIKGLEP